MFSYDLLELLLHLVDLGCLLILVVLLPRENQVVPLVRLHLRYLFPRCNRLFQVVLEVLTLLVAQVVRIHLLVPVNLDFLWDPAILGLPLHRGFPEILVDQIFQQDPKNKLKSEHSSCCILLNIPVNQVDRQFHQFLLNQMGLVDLLFHVHLLVQQVLLVL